MSQGVQLSPETTVRQLVGRYPQTRQVFETYGIDYCCGGLQPLSQAAASRGVSVDALITQLEEVLEAPSDQRQSTERDWYAASLSDLVRHIVDVHHAYLKKALPRLRLLTRKVLNAHGAAHGPMLQQVHDLFAALDEELTAHMAKEEMVLFPHIVSSEASRVSGQLPQRPPFGTVANPIQQMEHEHDSAGEILTRIREATNNYALPDDACPTFAALYEEIQQMEADLHQHIHLENNILFPRAIEHEGGGR